MSTKGGPDFVTSGLFFYVDAASANSVGNGTYWYDISGSNLHVAKVSTPAIATVGNATAYRFTAANQYFNSTFTMSHVMNGSNLTCEAFVYLETDVDTGGMITIVNTHNNFSSYHSIDRTTRKLSNYWYLKSPEGYHTTGEALSQNQWYHLVSVWNGTDGMVYQYVNLTKTSTATTGTGRVAGGINIGRDGTGRTFGGGIALIRLYNVALTDNQVRQNYQAHRNRFNLP